jgi:hypothetical protein
VTIRSARNNTEKEKRSKANRSPGIAVAGQRSGVPRRLECFLLAGNAEWRTTKLPQWDRCANFMLRLLGVPDDRPAASSAVARLGHQRLAVVASPFPSEDVNRAG